MQMQKGLIRNNILLTKVTETLWSSKLPPIVNIIIGTASMETEETKTKHKLN